MATASTGRGGSRGWTAGLEAGALPAGLAGAVVAVGVVLYLVYGSMGLAVEVMAFCAVIFLGITASIVVGAVVASRLLWLIVPALVAAVVVADLANGAAVVAAGPVCGALLMLEAARRRRWSAMSAVLACAGALAASVAVGAAVVGAYGEIVCRHGPHGLSCLTR